LPLGKRAPVERNPRLSGAARYRNLLENGSAEGVLVGRRELGGLLEGFAEELSHERSLSEECSARPIAVTPA